jgi:hypothetical protein
MGKSVLAISFSKQRIAQPELLHDKLATTKKLTAQDY